MYTCAGLGLWNFSSFSQRCYPSVAISSFYRGHLRRLRN